MTVARRSRVLAFTTAVLLSPACSDEGAVAPELPPTILMTAVSRNPNNVLSSVVTVGVEGAERVQVRWESPGNGESGAGPEVAVDDGPVVLPVLGLMPETRYVVRVVAHGVGGSVEGESLGFVTGSLPADLPAYVSDGPSPAPGYVVFAAGMYGLVIDNTGRVVWYHRFPAGPGLNFQAQPNGRYVARPPSVGPSAPAAWIEVDPLGGVTRLLGCARGLPSRFHDLLVEGDGSYWILCDETRPMDLRVLDGPADAMVIGTVVQRIGSDGALLFEWSVFDHFEITDLDSLEFVGPNVNWSHGNALDLDLDGNLLVSFRNLSVIAKIDTSDGRILWRLGGRRSSFDFSGHPSAGFARQHGVRVSGPSEILLLDNLGDPSGSRAERYLVDPEFHLARLVGSYGSLPAVTGRLGGTTQVLPGGRALVSFGDGARVEEYESTGAVAWRMEQPGYVFRAQRISSLYHPGVGIAR